MAANKKPASMKTVVAASAAGTAFEWYDFFLYVPLVAILTKTFFAGLNDVTATIFALGSFAVGFAFRPIGALIFGRIGDRIGRKATFLVTMILMGASTFAIGLLPSYAQAGILAPMLFIGLRILQGLALGGEWGGAAGELPIIALTANVMAHQRQDYLNAGMNGVVGKPISPHTLLNEIARLAGNDGTSMDLDAGAAA